MNMRKDLPFNKEELAKLTPTDSDMQEERLRQIHITILDKLTYQASMAIELKNELEAYKFAYEKMVHLVDEIIDQEGDFKHGRWRHWETLRENIMKDLSKLIKRNKIKDDL